MPGPYVVIGDAVAKPEGREEVQEILTSLAEPSRAEEGCISLDLLVSAEDPCTFIIYEVWNSKADYDRHAAQAWSNPRVKRMVELLARPPASNVHLMLSAPANNG